MRILDLIDLNRGETLKQGDSTILRFQIADRDHILPDKAGEQARVVFMYNNSIIHEEITNVLIGNIVEFSISEILPPNVYSLEIHVGGQIFPSDEFVFKITRSALNAEYNIINLYGVDNIVDRAVDEVSAKFVNLTKEKLGLGNVINVKQASEMEIVAARGGKATLGQRLDEIASFDMEHESAPLGEELVTATGWVSEGWTGDFATGFKHNTGNTTPLSYPLNAVAGKIYLVELTVDDTDAMNSGFKFTVSIGDSAPFQMYQGVGGTISYSKGVKAVNNGDLKIIPNSDFTGRVYDISVREVQGEIPPTTIINDSNDNPVFETRPTKHDLNNIFMGKNAGKSNITGFENTIIGNDAMPNSVTGFWNSALGYNALKNNINGSRSLAIGYRSLEEMISGHRNIAVGTFALHRVTTGANNIGIGADSAWHTTTGEGNIAIGTVSLDNNTTGSFNVAIGYNALRDNETTSFNIAIGHHALRMAKQNNNTAIGAFALSETVGSGGQTAIGYQALKVSTGANNTAIGQQTALNLKGGTDNTVVGRIGLLGLVTGSSNTVIGSSGARYMTEGNRNTLIGSEVGRTLMSGNDNILIGNRVTTPTAETDKYLNIGNLIYGDLAAKKIGIGVDNPLARLHLGAGTTSVPPIRINGGVLLSTPMNGAIESDGSYLYFTNSAGNRLRLVAENVAI